MQKASTTDPIANMTGGKKKLTLQNQPPEEIEMKPQRHFSYGQKKQMKDNQLSLTGEIDLDVVKLCPTGNPKYSTSLRIRNKRVYLHSTGIQISALNSVNGILVISIDLSQSLTVEENNKLNEYITRTKSLEVNNIGTKTNM